MTEKLYPLAFAPIFKERVWGGRNLERLFGKNLPVDKVIGESWEVCDRKGDESVVRNGPLAGMSLRQLIDARGSEVMGGSSLWDGRFPLLIKILDAQEKLSLQVHPPAEIANELGGDPKTEMWYMADCQPDAELYVGLKSGVSSEQFADGIKTGEVEDCFHRIAVSAGDSMFLPSGRVHAIGAGNIIFEIQQNSDTTYRVHDWGRVGLDGTPRELHIGHSLKSIDFNDFEPSLVGSHFEQISPGVKGRTLADCPLFLVQQRKAIRGATVSLSLPGVVSVLVVVKGQFLCSGNGVELSLSAGECCLLPASVETIICATEEDSNCLLATAR